jgi:hypothetical protein
LDGLLVLNPGFLANKDEAVPARPGFGLPLCFEEVTVGIEVIPAAALFNVVFEFGKTLKLRSIDTVFDYKQVFKVYYSRGNRVPPRQ